ncbi:hypothetical protein Scep_022730 [Stephania cephalantha]|uniref:Transposase n=1 Tax=Stephania cephalantha TaxID=152367 RepID=A0AAP0I2D8_9MAGN
MLESALHYRNAFNHLALSDPNFTFCPTSEEWTRLEGIVKFLKVFYDVTNICSSTNYPTSNLFFHGMWRIKSILLKEVRNPTLFRSSTLLKMQSEFDKYWEECSVILSIVVILDPRYKVKVVEFVYSRLYGNIGICMVNDIREKLYTLFGEYCNVDPKDGPSIGQPTQKDINGEDDPNDPYSMAYKVFQSQYSSSQVQKSQLDLYLEEPAFDRKKELDVLGFWRSVEHSYPQLCQMARDVLTIPFTTVAPESAFSLGSRVLDANQSFLTRQNLEALICGRDWLRASIGRHLTRTNDLDEIIDEFLEVDLNDTVSYQASNEIEID